MKFFSPLLITLLFVGAGCKQEATVVANDEMTINAEADVEAVPVPAPSPAEQYNAPSNAVQTTQAPPDSDGDGLYDSAEIKVYKTDPHNTDSDGDGYDDNDEVQAGFDPAVAAPK